MANVERLKLIQAIVDRMARNSFSCKSWSVTVVAALLGLSTAQEDKGLAVVAVFALLAFAFLDTRYLTLERAYRDLYEAASIEDGTDNWSLRAGRLDVMSIVRSVASFSIWPLYGLELVVAAGVASSA